MYAQTVFALIIINKAGGLVYNKTFHDSGLHKISTNDYLVLAGTFHGCVSHLRCLPMPLVLPLIKSLLRVSLLTYTVSTPSPPDSTPLSPSPPIPAPTAWQSAQSPLRAWRCWKQKTFDCSASTP
ncbi:hypothetical protein MAA_11242 [Metarhizium robertsii ARSEF 23]|uniref:Trafficking protein particle complex subunit n=1 Tax=Metarhizium robertsii (strain ARSEF 23 / ATCC MYA-3075) TaxID=655844 RepID=A0A0B2XGS4_METRA|nr:uncharacterized protein MAA_11242 [Metarhizium robertsii ARSEF 23]KHO11164.1 hypothetical protein MAA_11242 [Metarhizium robertsii ARSEF 23]